MLGVNATRLLRNLPSGFPLLHAVAASLAEGCKTCGHRSVSPPGMLRAALNKYRNDPEFIALCKRIFGALPITINGVTIEEIAK